MTRTLLAQAINRLWEIRGAAALEKNAAALYFYELKKPELDKEAFGGKFCKLASNMGKDPWKLALDIYDNYSFLEKQASYNNVSGTAARFCIDWSDELIKKAAPLARGFRVARKAVSPKAPLSPPTPAAGKVPATQAAPVSTPPQPATTARTRSDRNNVDSVRSRMGAMKKEIIARRQAAQKPLPGSSYSRAVNKQQRHQMASASVRQMSPEEIQRRGLIVRPGEAIGQPSAVVGKPISPTTKPAPQSAPAQAAPAQSAPVQGTAPSEQAQTPQGSWTRKAIGTAAIGIPAAGYMAFSGSNSQQQPSQGYGY